MKFTIMRDALQKVAAVAASAAGTSRIPVLQNALVEASGGEVSFTATNLDESVRLRVSAEVTVPGVTTIPAKLLADIAAKVPTGAVVVELVGDAVEVRAGRSRFSLPTITAADFPSGVIPEYPDNGFALTADELEAVASVIYAAKTEETEPTLCGVHIRLSAGQVRATATNRHRLARVTIPREEGAEGEVIIRAPALRRAAKMFSGESVTVRLADRGVGIFGAHAETHCRVIEGPYPDTDRLFPQDFNTTIRCSRADLLAAVERVGLVSRDDQTRRAEFDLNGSLKISSARDARASDELTDVTYEGGVIRFGANLGYVTDALTSLDAEDIEWLWTAPRRASVLRGVGDRRTEALVMPLNLLD